MKTRGKVVRNAKIGSFKAPYFLKLLNIKRACAYACFDSILKLHQSAV